LRDDPEGLAGLLAAAAGPVDDDSFLEQLDGLVEPA
jgi:hypothetical protein